MDEHEQLIIAIVLGIVGFLSMMIIICFFIWFFLRRKSKSLQHKQLSSISRRQPYRRSEKFSPRNVIDNKRRRQKGRFNTNDSVISFSFQPPHLINQNVRNLDRLLASESTVYYEEKSPIDR